MAYTKIDHATVQKIIDTANIVEVVSEFVHLRRRGANYVGLCPFHNERTPSFSVSPARGVCKCFSCGKGGSVVGFLMEHEQLTYVEALKWLAKKYHIEIEEHELTDDERREMDERQGMMEANQFAMEHFERNMAETDDGRDIGLSYFRQRGINDLAIKRFHLGYALDKRDDLQQAAQKAGIKEKYLVDTGLCIRNDRGSVYDRFKGRVIYPVFTISGKVVAFGGRTLRSDKEVAKYVNSPESIIYSKSKELYGLYQAKQAIVKKDCCILVEGYMDVISMHQRGIENVVASSGTSLTQGQTRLIHRFTENVTVIYDSDAAGIKASLRGIDILLAEGLNIKVLLLPDGDDPDSFAQSHTSEEVEAYMRNHEVDFIKFKMDILLEDCAGDPVKRSKVLASIIKSIAHIPAEITRTLYIKEAALRFGVDEAVLLRQLNADIAQIREGNARQNERDKAMASIGDTAESNDTLPAGNGSTSAREKTGTTGEEKRDEQSGHAAILAPQEKNLLRIVLKYGLIPLGQNFATEAGAEMLVADYVAEDLEIDHVSFSNRVHQQIFNEVMDIRRNEWPNDYAVHQEKEMLAYNTAMEEGRERIKSSATSTEEIARLEADLEMKCRESYDSGLREFALNYLVKIFTSHPDAAVRNTAVELCIEKHKLSRIYSKGIKLTTDLDRLDELVPKALIALKYDMARCQAEDLRNQIAEMQRQPGYDFNKILELMEMQTKWQNFCLKMASHLGERVYEPLR